MGHMVVLGVTHNVQGAEKWCGRRLDDSQYRTVLGRLLDGKDFVFEEATGLGPRTAEKLSLERLGPGRYLDVDPAVEQRPTYGIPKDTGGQSLIDACDPETDSLYTELIDPHSVREKLWLQRIQERTFGNGLLVCGFLHSLSMSFRLQSAGYTVEATFCYLPWRRFCRSL